MMHLMRGVATALGVALGLLLVGCQTVQTTRSGEVGVDRQQRMSSLVTASEVDAAARQEYGQITQEAQKKGELNHDAAQTDRVRRIAQRLIPHTGVFRDDAPRWQ